MVVVVGRGGGGQRLRRHGTERNSQLDNYPVLMRRVWLRRVLFVLCVV